jgi:hypothetical protein
MIKDLMSIQILQYEFLGPIKLDDWGPPMEKVIYLIFSRNNDSFNIIYVGDCEKTDKDDFFENNENFTNWTQITGSKDLYLAILPMFESDSFTRQVIIEKIRRAYKPICNVSGVQEKTDYVIRSKLEKTTSNISQKDSTEIKEKTLCPCCGAKMSVDKILENTIVLKCDGCGLSDTRLNL